MKKVLILLFCLFFLTSCTDREDFYVLSFDDYTLSVGYDDVEFMDLVFSLSCDEDTLDPYEMIEDVEVTYWDRYFGTIDITNYKKKECDIQEGVITKIDIFLDELDMRTYMIDGQELSRSVRENCRMFDGEYIKRNGYACAIVKNVEDKNNVIVLYGDILKEDQDELSRIVIYVE